MLCASCGAENNAGAAFCGLCHTRFDDGEVSGRSRSRERTVDGRTAAPRANAQTEHEWWVRRRSAAAEAMSLGLPTAGGTYALVAFDRQVRDWRALWWSAGVFIAFCALSMMRMVAYDWGPSLRATWAAGAPVIVQAFAIALFGAAAACLFAVWVGGRDAWQATLVSLLPWGLLTAILAAVGTFGGEYGLMTATALFMAAIFVTVSIPFTRSPSREVPRTAGV